MVIIPRRGSLICVRMDCATSSRTRSACRRTLAGSVISSTSTDEKRAARRIDFTPSGVSVVVTVQPAPRGEHLDLGPPEHQAFTRVQDLGHVGRVGRYHRYPDLT